MLSKADYPGPLKLRRILESARKDHWAGFQIYYHMSESDVKSATGQGLVESVLAVYRERVPAMNLCIHIQLADQSLSVSGWPANQRTELGSR